MSIVIKTIRDVAYLQRDSPVGQEAWLQGVHEVHVDARHFDADLLPAQLLRPLGRAVTAVNDEIRTIPVAPAGVPQRDDYAQQTQRSHGGLRFVLFFSFSKLLFQVISSQLL